MRDAVRAVEDIFRQIGAGEAESLPRRRLKLPGGRRPARVFHSMAAASAALGFFGLKAYASGRDGARFVFLLFEQESGALAAVMEADALGRIRTGAATGVAADHLAPPGAASVGIVGCGGQARTQLEALAAVRPVTRVDAYCRSPERRAKFAEEMTEALGIPVHPAASAEAAVRDRDLVVAITSSRTPVVRGAWLSSGAFVAAAGGNSRSRRELDAEAVLGRGRIVVDDLRQAREECGDLTALADAGDLDWGAVESLGAVVAGGRSAAGPGAGAGPPAGGSLFESQGIAAEDLAAAVLVYRRAAAEAPPLAGGAAAPRGVAARGESPGSPRRREAPTGEGCGEGVAPSPR